MWEHLDEKNNVIKLKADIHRNFALSLKNHIREYGSYVFGVGVSDFGGSNRFKYGLQFDLNL